MLLIIFARDLEKRFTITNAIKSEGRVRLLSRYWSHRDAYYK